MRRRHEHIFGACLICVCLHTPPDHVYPRVLRPDFDEPLKWQASHLNQGLLYQDWHCGQPKSSQESDIQTSGAVSYLCLLPKGNIQEWVIIPFYRDLLVHPLNILKVTQSSRSSRDFIELLQPMDRWKQAFPCRKAMVCPPKNMGHLSPK